MIPLWVAVPALALPGVPRQYSIHTWQADEHGLPQNAVTAVLQTRDGYLWVGTYSGLVRFDGAQFKVFDSGSTPELKSSRVTSLSEDAAGNLWIGNESGDLTCYRNGHFQSVAVRAAWPRDEIAGIASDAQGEVWLMNRAGLVARVSDGRLLTPRPGTVSSLVALESAADGTLWVVRDGRVSILKSGQLLSPSFDQPEEGYYLQGVCPSHDGGLWVAWEGNLGKWKNDRWEEAPRAAPWGQNLLLAFHEMRNGVLAAGTLAHGLFLVLPDQTWLQFSRTNGLSQDWIRTLGEDREGNLWVGTGSGGLNVLRAARVQTVSPPDQWDGRAVSTITVTRDETIWAGTEGAGLYRLRDGAWTRFDENTGLSNRFVWSLAEDERGQLWAGTWGGGIFVKNGERFERDPALADLTTAMTAMLAARNGDLWIGTPIGLLCRDAQGGRHWYGRQEGLDLPDVRAIAETRDGVIWFGMLGGGLGQLRDGKIRQFRKTDGLSSDFVQCLRLDKEGTLWAGTAGGGLNRFKQGRFASIGVAQGFPNNVICHLEEDDRGYFWVSSYGGIFRVSKADLDACADGKSNQVQCLTYGRAEGMPTLECTGGLQPSGCRTADGRLWFPTSSGLVVVNPDAVETNPLPPPVAIEELLIEDSLADLTQPPVRVPPGRRRLEFHYTGLSFVAPDKVRFRYRLEGLDERWLEARTVRTATYTHVPPGRYTFRVTACNNDGVWNETGASLAIEVLPFFWQTWWFRSVAGLVVVGAVAWGVRFDTHRRMRRNLERLERQRVIERERARIAKDIHDDLGASLTRITMLSQTARGEVHEPEQVGRDLERIYGTARELTRALDEIVWAVNPQHDTLDSLAGYLCRFAQDFLAAAGVRCRLDVPLDLPPWPLSAEVRHNLFLAFKEGLHNVVKHAAATEVRVSLALEPTSIRIVIEDNGTGVAHPPAAPSDPASLNRPSRGNGLINMRRRLEAVDGRFELESAPGKGTRVTFWLSRPAPVS